MLAYLRFRLALLRIARRERRTTRAYRRDFKKAASRLASEEEWAAVAKEFADRAIAEQDATEEACLEAFRATC